MVLKIAPYKGSPPKPLGQYLEPRVQDSRSKLRFGHIKLSDAHADAANPTATLLSIGPKI